MSASRHAVAFVGCLALLILTPLTAFGQFFQQGVGMSKKNVSTATPVSAPRELRIHLERAQKAVEEKQYDVVCDHIRELLKSDTADYFVDGAEGSGGLKEEVARLALGLRGKAREAYELRFGAEAEALLDKVLENRKWSELDRLQFHYVGTKAGAKAALMSARLLMDRGEPAAAAMRLRRILDSATEFEPELSLLLASCWLQADDRSSARQTLLRLHQRQKPDTIQLGSRDIAWFKDAGELDAWIDKNLTPALPPAQKAPSGERLKFRLAWSVATGENVQELDVLTALRDQFNRKGMTAMPVLSPLDCGDWMVARSTRRLFGFDPVGGKRVWVYPNKPTDDLDDELTTTLHQKRKSLTAAGEAIFRRTWTDGLYAGITANDKRLYLIDGLTAPQPKSRYGRTIRPVRFPFNDPNSNRLVSLDLTREGAVAWTIGGPDGKNEKLKRAFFVSPPLIQGDQVFVLAEVEQQIKLYALSQQSGEVQWEQTLLVLNNDKISTNTERRLRGGRLAVENGMLLAWTGAQYLFGIDLSAKRFIWKIKVAEAGATPDGAPSEIETYPLNTRQNTYYRGGSTEDWREFLRIANPNDRWSDAALLCSGRFCVITPPSLNTMLCIDLYTGKTVWSKPKRDFLYVACEYDDSILVVGRYRIALVGLADGRPKWVSAQQSLGVPSGKGVRVGRYFYLPTSEGELLSVDMTSGEMNSKATEQALGNLSQIGDLIVSQSPTSFVAFAPQDGAEAPAPPTIAANAKIEELIEQLGDRQFRAREEAEKKLREMGESAAIALKAGLESTDPETRIRCRRLLTQVFKDGRVRLLAAFRKNDPKDSVSLPGWKAFQAAIGKDEEARALFADMYAAEFALFEKTEKNPTELSTNLQQRCTELQTAMRQYQYQLSLPTVATIVYLSSHKGANQNATVASHAASFCSQSSFRQGIADKKRGPLLKKLIIGLMDNSVVSPNYSLVNLGMQYDIKECYGLARRVLESNQQGYAKAYAMSAISRYGTKEKDTPLIEKLMKNTQQCSSYSVNGKRYVTQIRDVALVSLIQLHKQDPKQFGFKRYQKQGHFIAMHTIGFLNDKDRKPAYDKWKEFKEGKFKPKKAASSGVQKAANQVAQVLQQANAAIKNAAARQAAKKKADADAKKKADAKKEADEKKDPAKPVEKKADAKNADAKDPVPPKPVEKKALEKPQP